MLPFQMSSSEGPGSDTEGDLKPEGNEVTEVDEKEKGSEAKNQAKGEAEGKKRKWNRGKHMTPSKRARQFVGVMEVREGKMWCLACDCPIQHSEKSIADSHVKSKKHQVNVEKLASLVKTPGPSAKMSFQGVSSSSSPAKLKPEGVLVTCLFCEKCIFCNSF